MGDCGIPLEAQRIRAKRELLEMIAAVEKAKRDAVEARRRAEEMNNEIGAMRLARAERHLIAVQKELEVFRSENIQLLNS
jgi:hypothetical protein